MATVVNVAANLQVGEFKLCIIATGSLADEQVTLSRVVVDLPEFVPHFYVLVEVLEEQEAANVYGFLSYQQLVESLNVTSLQSEWTYQLSMSWFDDNTDRLLLYLRCLEPDAIRLPAIPTNRVAISTIESELAALLPQLQSGENHQINLLRLLTQPAINAGRWLWNELDEVAEELSWVLLPITQASAMRSPAEEFEVIVAQLRQTGVEIPLQARAAFKDLLLAGISVRLYAMTWQMVYESEQPEWTLLLILGSPALSSLPHNVKLRIIDQNGILVERELEARSDRSYIFTRVVGSLDEKFLVSVSSMDGVEVTFLPFAFDLGR